jgi:hypothetical protein
MRILSRRLSYSNSRQKHLRVASLHTSAMLGSAYSTGRDVYEVLVCVYGKGE